MRFVPVPYAAIEAVDVSELHAVADLYKRAHSLRWHPFEITERSLRTRWGMSGRQCWRLLHSLERLGLLTITKGSRRSPTVIAVVCVTNELQHVGQHVGQHNGAGSKPTINKSDAQGDAQGGALLTRDETRDENTPKPPRGVLRILSAVKGREVTTARKTAQAAIANFIKKTGASVEEVELVARAFHKCPHPYFARDVRAEGWEGGTDRRKSLATLLVQSRWEDRLEAATEWQTTPAKSKGFDLAEWERNLPASVRANMEPR